MPLVFYLLLAVLSGFAISTQTGINSQLKSLLGNPALAALLSFCVGTLTMILVNVFQGNALPTTATWQSLRWWHVLGGVIGAFHVTVVIIIAQKIGAGPTFGLIVAGQLLGALLFDHFGWLGFSIQPISWLRALGAVLIVAGVVLIRRF